MVNHEMMKYDFKEGVNFDGLMPKFIAEYSAATVGASAVVVKEFGKDAKGMDALEVLDTQKVME